MTASNDDRLGCSVRRVIDASRVALTAVLSGLARAVYDYSLPYVKERVVHGEPIGRKQAVAFKLADMHIAANAMRWMGLRAAAELDSNPEAQRRARLAQRYAAEQTLKIGDDGVQLFGGLALFAIIRSRCGIATRGHSRFDGLIGA